MRTKTLFCLLSIIVIFSSYSSSVRAQGAGVREIYGGGYSFDSEKYKVDVALQKLKNQPITGYQPSQAEYKHSKAPKVVKLYKPPKYPKDTLVLEVSDFVMQSNTIYPKSFRPSLASHDSLLLSPHDKFYKYASYSLASGHVINGLDYDFNGNAGVYCLVKKMDESDKKHFGIKVTIQADNEQHSYFFWVNNKAQFKVDEYLWNQSIKNIANKKTIEYLPDAVNELAVKKNAEKLSFLINGKEVHSVILEHPWTKFEIADPLLIVETDVKVCLYGYRRVWFPY